MRRKIALCLLMAIFLLTVVGLHFHHTENISSRMVVFDFPNHENIVLSVPMIRGSSNADLINNMIEDYVREVIQDYAEQAEEPITLQNTYACTYKRHHIISFRFSVDIMRDRAAYPITKVFGLTVNTDVPEVLSILQATGCEDWEDFAEIKGKTVLYGSLWDESDDELLNQVKEWCALDKCVRLRSYYLERGGTVLIFDKSHMYGDYAELLLRR